MLLAFLWLVITLPGAAQETPEPPPRHTERTAPERQVEILEREVLPHRIDTIIAIPANADSYIASERPTENFGSDALFLGYNLTGSNNFGAERILLRFDVAAAVPAGAIINSAVVNLYLSFSSPAPDAAMGTVLRRLASPWNEYAVSWNTEPSWTPIDDTTFVGSALGWYGWDITEVVEDWHTAVYPNNGVEIIGDEAIQQRERAFYSRETATSFYPQLIVNYTLSDDTEPPITTIEPLPPFSRRSFTVSWTGTDPGDSGIDHYDIQVRVDDGDWQTWLSGVTVTEAEYSEGENGRTYEFRSRAVDNVGNSEAFAAAEAETTVDAQAPTSSIDPLPPIINSNSFTVSWTGSDNVSGIQYYDVQYRYNNSPWSMWLPQTLATSAQFTNAADGLYAFEVRAVDNLGQVELFNNIAEATIIVDSEPPFIEPQIWLPLIVNQP